MSLKKKALRAVVWSFIEKWGGQLISTSIFLLLARLLGPEDFGLVALASVFIAFMSSFVDQGFTPAIIQREELEKGHLDTAFWLSNISGILLMLSTFLCSSIIAKFFNEPKLDPVIRYLSFVFVLIGLQGVQDAVLRRDLAFKKLAFRSLIATSTSGFISLILAFLGFGVWSLVAQQIVNRTMNVLMLWASSSWRPGLSISIRHFQDLFSFSIYMMGINFLRFFNQRSDDFLIGYFLGPIALGYYTVAYRFLLLMVNVFTNTTTAVALPAFSRLQNDHQRLRNAFYKAIQFTSLIALPAFMILLVVTPEVVTIAFGEKWKASIPVMQVLVLAGILHSTSYFNGTVLMAKGKPNWRMATNSLNAVTNVIGFIIAVNYGIIAVSIAFVISNYLIAPINLLIVKRLIGISYIDYLKQYTSPALASFLILIITFFIRATIINVCHPITVLLTCLTSGILLYSALIFTIDRSLFNQAIEILKSQK